MAQRLRFFIAHAITGKFLAEIFPTQYEINEPLLGSGTATITLPTPEDLSRARAMRALLYGPSIQLAVRDEQRRYLFTGPLPARPEENTDGSISLSFVDWRAWVAQCVFRPDPAVASWTGDYIKIGAAQVDQSQAVADIVALALNTHGAPANITVPAPALSGTAYDLTFRALTPVGDALDSISSRKDGVDWWIDAVDSATLKGLDLIVRVAPERKSRAVPVDLGWDRNGGNLIERPVLPASTDRIMRVWATGDGAPPDQVWGLDEDPDFADMTDTLLWERITTSDATTKADAFSFAAAERIALSAPDGVVEVQHLAGAPALGDYVVGDRSRLVVRDGWTRIDVPAARILERKIVGGTQSQIVAVLKLDLADSALVEVISE